MLYLLLNNNPRSFREGEKPITVRSRKGRAERSRTMKHILPILTAALALTASTAFAALTSYTGSDAPSAAFDYKVEVVPYVGQYNQGNDWEYFKIKINSGSGRIYLVDFMNSPDWDSWETFRNQSVTRYGYYDVKGKDISYNPTPSEIHTTNVSDANVKILQTLERTDAGQTFHRYGYDLGKEFTAGDEVGIWIEKNGNAVGSFTAVPNTNTSRYREVPDSKDQWALSSGYVMPVAALEAGSHVRFGLFFSASEQQPIGGGDDQTVGSPLPGGLQIALIAGLFGLGFYFVRRRKATVA